MDGRDGLELSLAEMGARCDGSRAALVEAEEVMVLIFIVISGLTGVIGFM